MEERIDKKWKIHELKDIDLKGESDVTNTWSTLGLIGVISILLLLFYFFPPKENNLINQILLIGITLFLLRIFYILTYKNKNFILYDLLYLHFLKIKIVTIEDPLTPTIPAIEEIEKIITKGNQNCETPKKDNKCPDLQNGVTFFWIRKDRLENQKRDIKYFIPYLSLIITLYALKEKSLRLISIIGLYFVTIGLLYITFTLLLIRYLKGVYHIDNFISGVVLIILLALWYTLTIRSALKVVSIEGYLTHINKEVRRAYIRKFTKIGKGYEQIIKSFVKESAVYIYDYTIDKYQLVDKKFLNQKLKKNHKFITKSVSTIITAIISVIFMLFVETSANIITTEIDINNTIDYSQKATDIYNTLKEIEL